MNEFTVQAVMLLISLPLLGASAREWMREARTGTGRE